MNKIELNNGRTALLKLMKGMKEYPFRDDPPYPSLVETIWLPLAAAVGIPREHVLQWALTSLENWATSTIDDDWALPEIQIARRLYCELGFDNKWQ